MPFFTTTNSGRLLLPVERVPTQAEIWDQYFELHKACPQCGSDDVAMTCVGFVFPVTLEAAKDTNRCDCACGWSGIRHDMVPDKRDINVTSRT